MTLLEPHQATLDDASAHAFHPAPHPEPHHDPSHPEPVDPALQIWLQKLREMHRPEEDAIILDM